MRTGIEGCGNQRSQPNNGNKTQVQDEMREKLHNRQHDWLAPLYKAC
jgi:hypothetical protein